MSDSHAYPKDDRTWAIQYLTNAMKGERKRAEHLRAADIYPDQDIIKAHNAAVSQLPPPPDASENAFDITSPPPGHHLAEWLKHASNPDEPRNVPLASPLAEQSQAEDDRRFTRETPPPEDMWDGQVCRQAPKVLKRKDRDDDSVSLVRGASVLVHAVLTNLQRRPSTRQLALRRGFGLWSMALTTANGWTGTA